MSPLIGTVNSIHSNGNLAAYPVDPVKSFAQVSVHGSFPLGVVVDEFQHMDGHIVQTFVAFAIEGPGHFCFVRLMSNVVATMIAVDNIVTITGHIGLGLVFTTRGPRPYFTTFV